MYAFLSRFASVLLHPFHWILLLLLTALAVRSQRWRKRLLLTSLLVAVAFGNGWILHVVHNWWEPEPQQFDQIQVPFDVGVVLGGFTNLHATPLDRLHLGDEANRFTQAIELYHEGKILRDKVVPLEANSAEIARRYKK